MNKVFVVVSEWDGPGFRNPGDASPSVTEGVFLNKEDAWFREQEVRKHYRDMGHEPFENNGDDRNCDTWAFDTKIEEHEVK